MKSKAGGHERRLLCMNCGHVLGSGQDRVIHSFPRGLAVDAITINFGLVSGIWDLSSSVVPDPSPGEAR